jgi:uncharacterized protein (TIGR04255 family)
LVLEEKRIPDSIEECPLKEVVLEIRYKSNLPSAAIFGVIYNVVKDNFDTNPIELPIMQLPEDIRATDPSLRYQAYYKLQRNDYSLNIGPRSISFAITENYEGWTKFKTFYQDYLKRIIEIHLFKEVDRIGLRFVNIFDKNILDKLNMEVRVADDKLSSEPMNISIDYQEDSFFKKVKIGNNVNVLINGNRVKTSLVDIDYIMKVKNISEFTSNPFMKIEEMHNNEKKYFFSLLNNDYLKELNPVYNEERSN